MALSLNPRRDSWSCARPSYELRHERDDAGARAGADERHRDDRVEGGKRVSKISEKRSGVGGLFAVLGGGVPIDAGQGCRRSAGCTGPVFKVSRGPLLPEPRIPRWKAKVSPHGACGALKCSTAFVKV